MTSQELSRSAFLSCAAAAMLAACGGPQPPIGASGAILNSASRALNASTMRLTPSTVATVRHARTSDYKVSGPLLYVTNFDAPPYDDVTVYDAKENNPTPIAFINTDASQSNGDCIDASGTLYVGNDPASNLGWVSEYALGQTKPLRIITQGIDTPAFCAIDHGGNLWVTNFGGPTVTEYLKGSTVPHFTLKGGLSAPDGIAIDHGGNIYVGNLDVHGTSNVQVYPPGRKAPSRTITDGITWPIGIAVDAEGNLYVTNDVSPCNIEKYRAGQSHPYQTITNEIDGPTAVTFAKTGRMFEVNEGVQGCTGNGPWPAILEFRQHSLSPSKRMISDGLHTPSGVAYYPPLLP